MTKKKKNKSNNSSRDAQSSCQSTNNNYTSKKRKRSSTKEEDEQFNIDSNNEMDESIVPHVISWLQKRKKKVPDALLKSDNTSLSSFSNVDSVLHLLPSLRERERRALIRHVEKGNNSDGGTNSDKKELEGSDGEYDIHDITQMDASIQNSNSGEWPSNVTFSNNYQWDTSVPNEIKDKYSPRNAIRQRAPRLSNKVYFKQITDKNHPAYGEFGLYCALSHAKPGSWLLDYVGHITLGEDQDKTSDYVSDFGEKSELACDANNYGNEARFLNDFRNTGRHPNVEFNTRRDKHGELRQGVFVKLAKDARDAGFDGVRKDEELLVSYGKSYWRSRVGNLTDFVWRLPGQPMPKERGKPPN